MTVHEKALIMEADDMERVLRRIAIEIVERNKGLTDVVLLGVQRRGVTLAHRLREIFRQTEKVRVPTGELDVTLEFWEFVTTTIQTTTVNTSTTAGATAKKSSRSKRKPSGSSSSGFFSRTRRLRWACGYSSGRHANRCW